MPPTKPIIGYSASGSPIYGGAGTLNPTAPPINPTQTTPTGLASIAQPKPTSTPSTSPTPPNLGAQVPTEPGAGMSDTSFLGLLNNLNQGFQTNNDFVKQKNAVVNAMLGGKVDQAQLEGLPDNIKAIIKSGDRNQLMMQAQVLNDQISGYGKGVASSIQYLTQGYQNAQQQAEQEKEQAFNVLKELYTETGDPTALKNFIKTNYGDAIGHDTVDSIVNGVIGSVTPVDAAIQAIVGNESGGNYQAVSQAIKSGQYAGHKSYGKYQVLDVNIPTWTKEATGIALTPEQFLASKEAQDAVAQKRIGDLWDKYGNIADVASVWFTGLPAKEGAGRTDSTTGMTQEQYIQKATESFNKLNSAQTTNNQGGAPGTTGSSSIDSSTSGYAIVPIALAGDLTQAAIDQAAMKYALTGTMPSIGLSSTGKGGMRKNAILNRAGELEGAGNIEGNKVKLKSLNDSLSKQTDYLNTMERSINTVDENLKILENGANKVNNSNSPLINEWTNLTKTKVIGDGDLNAYKAAIQTVRTEYSNILARGGQVTEGTREEAKTLIPDNITKSQLQSVLAVLRTEGQNVKDQAQKQVDSIADQINGIVAPGGNKKTTSSVSSSSSDWMTDYNYERDIANAKAAIAAGGDKNAIKQKLLQKYKEVTL